MMNLLNTKSKLSYLLFLGIVCCACILGSCKDDDVIDPDGSFRTETRYGCREY